jgi:ribonuclease VapC
MMFLDASAIIAILSEEEDAGYLIAKIELSNKPVSFSPLSAFEAVMGLARKKSVSLLGDQVSTSPKLIDQAKLIVGGFLKEIAAVETTITTETYSMAIHAARAFGKAVAHPARLNFGDCFAYACAKTQHVPLLFKGDDFTQTDIEAA